MVPLSFAFLALFICINNLILLVVGHFYPCIYILHIHSPQPIIVLSGSQEKGQKCCYFFFFFADQKCSDWGSHLSCDSLWKYHRAYSRLSRLSYPPGNCWYCCYDSYNRLHFPHKISQTKDWSVIIEARWHVQRVQIYGWALQPTQGAASPSPEISFSSAPRRSSWAFLLLSPPRSSSAFLSSSSPWQSPQWVMGGGGC